MNHSPYQDPTRLFTVVGAPYIHETSGPGHLVQEPGKPRRAPRIGLGIAGIAGGCALIALSVSALAGNGAARLVEVACQAVK